MTKLTDDKVPSYRLHKASGQAIVTLNGQDSPLGKFKPADSKAEYNRRIAEWISAGRRRPAFKADLSIAELIARYRVHCESYYRHPDGTPTDEADITREELFRFLCGPAEIETYDTVERWPHESAMQGSYYLAMELPALSGEGEFSPLNELLSRFNANSEQDRSLLLAMAFTLVWGGLPGNRPAFVFTSQHGRGTGKTTTAEVLSSIVGGCIGINPKDREDRIFSRLLSEQGRAIECHH